MRQAGAAPAAACGPLIAVAALDVRASAVVTHGLSSRAHRPNSCGTPAQLPHGTRDLPGPEIQSVSLASPELAAGSLPPSHPGSP